MAKKQKESTKFSLALRELGYESIGEFLEIVGGFSAMVSEGKDASYMAKPLAEHCGQLIERIGHLEAVKKKNKQLKEIDDKIEETKVEAEVKDTPAISMQLDPELLKGLK